MAGTIVASFGVEYTPSSGRPTTIAQFNETVTQSTELKKLDSVVVPTSDTVIDLSALSTFGKVFIQNVDGTNYVEFGPTASAAIAPMVKLKPGEFAWVRLSPGITLRGRANTASVKCDVFGLND